MSETISVLRSIEAGSELKAITAGPSRKLPESLRLLDLVGTDQDPYNEGGQWAEMNDVGGRVFMVTQNLVHEPTGRELISETRIKDVLEKKQYPQWAYILHDKDVYTESDTSDYPNCQLGEKKASHYHIVFRQNSYTSIGVIARAFGVPPNCVDKKPNGSFGDLVEYLTHEHANQQKLGKHLYADEEVIANFDVREFIDDHVLKRSRKGKSRKDKEKLDQIFLDVSQGILTVDDVRLTEPLLYAGRGVKSHLEQMRADYLMHQESPEQIINIYVYGDGGHGKDLLAKALARSLAPDASRPFFHVHGENVSFEGYDGEPVIIWEDKRVSDMLKIVGGRGPLFQLLGPYREPGEAPVVHIKYGRTKLVNGFNIISSATPYEEFLRGLAGEYTSYAGGQLIEHKAENVAQGYRRFPIIIPVEDGAFSIYVNLGFLNGTREYEQYEKYGKFRQSLELLKRRCNSLSDDEKTIVESQVETQTVAPIVDQIQRLSLVPSEPATVDDLLAEFSDSGQIVRGWEDAKRYALALTASEILNLLTFAIYADHPQFKEFTSLSFLSIYEAKLGKSAKPFIESRPWIRNPLFHERQESLNIENVVDYVKTNVPDWNFDEKKYKGVSPCSIKDVPFPVEEWNTN